MKRKLSDSQERQKNILLESKLTNPCYNRCGLSTSVERWIGDGPNQTIGNAIGKGSPNGSPNGSISTPRKEVVVPPRLMYLLSSTPSAGSPLMSTVPSTNSLNVVTSSPAPTLRVSSPQALPIGSPEALSLQMKAAEDDPFGHEMRSTSCVSVTTTASATVAKSELSNAAFLPASRPAAGVEGTDTSRTP